MCDRNTSIENESFEEKAYNTKLLADCTFKFSSSKELQANRTLLALNSPVFYSMFFRGLSESKTEHPVIEIPDCNADAFDLVLRYFYTRKIEFQSCEMAVQVYYIARKYEVVGLENVAKAKIFEIGNSSAAAMMHDLAILFDDKKMQEFAVKMIQESTGDVVTSLSFLQATIPTVETIINECSSNISERTIFKALETYAKKNNCIDALRKIAIKKIRFLRMTNKEIAQCLANSVLLTNEEKLQILLCSMMRKQANQEFGGQIKATRRINQSYDASSGSNCSYRFNPYLSISPTTHEFDPKYPLPSGFTTDNTRMSFEYDLRRNIFG